MTTAPMIRLEAPAEVRARRLAALYVEAANNPAFPDALDRLPRHFSREDKARWRGLLAVGDLEPLALELVQRHYDPAYARSAEAHGREVLGVVALRGAEIDPAVADVAALLSFREVPGERRDPGVTDATIRLRGAGP